jgi:hypothetical protein
MPRLKDKTFSERRSTQPHFAGQANRVVYVPFSEFRKALSAMERADLDEYGAFWIKHKLGSLAEFNAALAANPDRILSIIVTDC